MNSVPYPFVGTPQYPGPSMTPGLYGPSSSPMAFGQQLQMHSAATPQMQGPAPSSMGYGSRFTPNWQSGLPANGPGPLPGAAPRPVTGPMSPMQERFAAGPRTGSWPPAPGGAAVFSSNRPPMPAPAAPAAPAAGGMMSRLLGLGSRVLMNPLAQGAAVAAPFMLEAAEQSMPGQMLGAMSPDGGLGSYIMDAAQQPAPAPAPQMQAPAPMAQSLSPYPETTAMRYPVPIQAPMPMAPAPQMQAPAPMPAPMPAPQMQAPAPQGAVWQGQNAGIQDDTRARAMAWLALQQGMR
jgi:hypothetical protein